MTSCPSCQKFVAAPSGNQPPEIVNKYGPGRTAPSTARVTVRSVRATRARPEAIHVTPPYAGCGCASELLVESDRTEPACQPRRVCLPRQLAQPHWLRRAGPVRIHRPRVQECVRPKLSD